MLIFVYTYWMPRLVKTVNEVVKVATENRLDSIHPNVSEKIFYTFASANCDAAQSLSYMLESEIDLSISLTSNMKHETKLMMHHGWNEAFLVHWLQY